MGTAQDAVKRLKTVYLGVRESPMGSNKTIVGLRFGWNGVAWCHELASLVLYEIGLEKNKDFPWTASCPVGKSWFQSKNRWYHTPQVGDFVYYSNYGKNGSPYHIEIVIAVTSSTITTIGGNTSGHAGNVNGNGDGCYQKTLSRGLSRISGYGRPFYGNTPTSGEDDMPIYVSIDKTDKSRKEELTPNEWHQIYFNQNNSKGAEHYHSKTDAPSFLTGNAYYQGDAQLVVRNLPKGTAGQVRFVYTDTKTNDTKSTCSITEFTASDGDTYVTHRGTGYLPKNNHLRVELVVFGAGAAATAKPTVVAGNVRLMAWEV